MGTASSLALGSEDSGRGVCVWGKSYLQALFSSGPKDAGPWVARVTLWDMVHICHSLPPWVMAILPFLDCLTSPAPAPAPQNQGVSSQPAAVWPDGTVLQPLGMFL